MGFSLSVPKFGQVVELNFSRAFLHRAADALERGDLLAAGALLREAVRRQLYAECEWFGCLPEGANEKASPRSLLSALRKAGRTNECGEAVAKDAIELGNRAAHCKYVHPSALRCCIELWHLAIDHDPCAQPVNVKGVRREQCEALTWDFDDTPDCGFEPNADYSLDDIDDDDLGGSKVKGGCR